jgi:hypothetical protein
MRVLHQSSASLLHFCADSCPVRQHRIGCGPAAVRLASGLMLAICCSLAGTGRAEVVLQPLDGTGKQGPNLVPNGGFEEIADNMPAGWKSQLPGTPMIDRQCVHGGKASLRFTKPDASTRFWVSRTIEINQPKAAPLVLSGWSKAEAVTGTKTAEYSVWVDLQYTDGTSLWGQRVLFDVGTHDWQHVEFPFVVSKPVKRASVSVLFRGAYTGTVWFDDVSLCQLDFDAGAIFDGGPVAAVAPPATPPAATAARVSGDGLTVGFGPRGRVTELTAGGESILGRPLGGFWVRDVARGGPWFRMLGEAKQEGGAVRFAAEEAAAGLRLEARLEPALHAIDIAAAVHDTSGADRAVTVCFVLPLADQPRVWHDDILRSTPVAAGSEYMNAQSWPAGASLSAYPFSSLTSERLGLSLAAPMDCPRVCRFVYNSWLNLFYAAHDFGLAKEPRKYRSSADFRLSLYRHEPAWGFRAAAQAYYDRFPQFFQQRLKRGGIWMALADISQVERFEDFGFAYDELGGNHRAFDDAQGIASFHYVEPMTHWLAMDKRYPRTYDGALAALADAEAKGNASLARLTKTTRRCGVFTAQGRYDLSLENQSWCDGAVFTLNPDPNLPEDDACPVNKAHLGYSKTWADKNLGDTAGGGLHGVYIDSMPNWGNVRNWRPEHWQTVDTPLTFDPLSKKPVLLQIFSTWQFSRWVADDVHARGGVMHGNGGALWPYFPGLLDVTGQETGSVLNEETMARARTLLRNKPYSPLMNTRFDAMGPEVVEDYFHKSLVWDIFPSFFNGAYMQDGQWVRVHYFRDPKFYNRDRHLFRKFIPILRQLFDAGWQPVTHARPQPARVRVERYGPGTDGQLFFALYNPSDATLESQVTVDSEALGLTPVKTATALVADAPISCRVERKALVFRVPLAGKKSEVVRLQR